MPGDDNSFPPGNNGEFDSEGEGEALRRKIADIYKKITGEDPEPATNDDILQFMRVINYNFISLTRLLHVILLKNADMDTTLMNLELSTVRMSKRLNQFFETNSMLDEIEEGEFNVSGSAADNNFIF